MVVTGGVKRKAAEDSSGDFVAPLNPSGATRMRMDADVEPEFLRDNEDEVRRKVEALRQMERQNSKGDKAKQNQDRPAPSREMQGQSSSGGMHSIDSDEEEDYTQSKKVEAMNDDDVGEGTEEKTIDREGEIAITPFNLKDEQEDGHFAKDGSFVWNKKDKDGDLTDSWLDKVDWGKVQERTDKEKQRREDEDEKEDEAEANYDEMANYRQMLKLLKPQESVARALRRLGGCKKTTAQKLKEKKRQREGKETKEEKENRENMTRLTGLADAILTRSGHMEVYEETFESITHRLKQSNDDSKTKEAATEIPEGVDDDDALDMFMDTAKKEDEAKGEPSKAEAAPKAAAEPEAAAAAISLEDEVLWEFHWSDEDPETVHGPHSSSEMLKWQESGFFADRGVMVRKKGTQDFRDGKRIDFDLYT